MKIKKMISMKRMPSPDQEAMTSDTQILTKNSALAPQTPAFLVNLPGLITQSNNKNHPQ